MDLYKILNDFTLENNTRRQNLGDENPLVALQEPPQEFVDVAKAILSGHFHVTTINDEKRIYPTCVEFYYHEEQDNGVKDPIVYHRNHKKISGDDMPNVFSLGVLHNHVSGIDIIFEKKANAANKIVTGIVRASALIREFMVKDKDGNIIKAVKNGKEIDKDDRSTYLYQALFGQFSIFDGFTIKWVDGKAEDFDSIKLQYCHRKNVMKYREPQDGELDFQKTAQKCERLWQFTINKSKK